MNGFCRIISVRLLAFVVLVFIVLSGGPLFASTLTSQFFSGDANALQIMSGTPYDMDDPAWLDASYDQNKNTFAYKVFSALLMLGYQTEISYNYQNSWETPHLLALQAFQTNNGLTVTNSLTSDCLLEIDQLLAVREQALAAVGQEFLLYNHMQPLHPNDISQDALAAIYTIPMNALPLSLQMSTYELVQCIAGQCDGFIQDPNGVPMSSWPIPIDLSSNYRFVGAYFDPRVNNSRMPSAAVHVDTVLHEYAHYLDGFIGWTKTPLQPHMGLIDTRGFHSISYELTSGTYCYTMRSSNPKDWVTKYGFNPGYGGCAAGTGVVFEEWAEAFSMYVAAGQDFRAATQQSAMVADKYDWLKNNVFYGVEFDTNLPRDLESGCNDVYGTSSAQPGYAHCDDNYVWDFTLPVLPPDTTPPSLTITSHTNNQHVTTTSITLAGTASDSNKGNNGIQQVTVNGTRASNATATGNGTASWSQGLKLSAGANTLTVIAYDNSSNHNRTTLSLTVYYDAPDTTGPSLTITSHTNNQHVTTTSITLAGTANDSNKGNNGIQQVTVNGTQASNDTATGNGTASWSQVVTLKAGANTLTVIAYDNSPNHNWTTLSLTVYYDAPDTTAPSLIITSHTNNQRVTTASITLAGIATDSGKGNSGIQQVTVNGTQASKGTATANGTANWSQVVTLSAGANTLTVIAYDNSPNHNRTTFSLTVYYDAPETTGPSLTITSHTNNQHVTTTSITLVGTASDSNKGNSGIQQVTVNGIKASNDTAIGNGTATWSHLVTLKAGANTLTAIAYDNSPNHNGTALSITVYYDAPTH